MSQFTQVKLIRCRDSRPENSWVGTVKQTQEGSCYLAVYTNWTVVVAGTKGEHITDAIRSSCAQTDVGNTHKH